MVSSTDGSPTSTRWKRRDSARSFSKCERYSSNVVEPMQRSFPDASAGLSRFEASMLPPLVAPAPTMVWISSMKRTACSRLCSAFMTRLEPLLEVAAVARASQQRAHVERVHHRLLERVRHLAVDDLLGQTFDERRLADAGVAHEDRVVLLPSREDLHQPLDLALPPDERSIRLAVASSFRFVVKALSGSFAGRGSSPSAPAFSRSVPVRPPSSSTLADAVGDVRHHVEARDAVLAEEGSPRTSRARRRWRPARWRRR